MATYCSECGTMIQEGEAVCRRCGTPVGGQSAPQNPVQPVESGSVSLFSDLKPYYREEFTKIYISNGACAAKFNVVAFFAWGPWYLMHVGTAVGILLLILWIVSLVFGLLGYGTGLIIAGYFMGAKGTMKYYEAYMKKHGLTQ